MNTRLEWTLYGTTGEGVESTKGVRSEDGDSDRPQVGLELRPQVQTGGVGRRTTV